MLRDRSEPVDLFAEGQVQELQDALHEVGLSAAFDKPSTLVTAARHLTSIGAVQGKWPQLNDGCLRDVLRAVIWEEFEDGPQVEKRWLACTCGDADKVRWCACPGADYQEVRTEGVADPIEMCAELLEIKVRTG